MAKRHFAFPPIEDISSWQNPFTGEVMESAEGQEAHRQTLAKAQSTEGIDRRNTFLQGPQKVQHKSRDTDEAQEAEIVQSNTETLRQKMLANARQHVGQSAHKVQDEDVEADVKVSVRMPRTFNLRESDTFEHSNANAKDSLNGATQASEAVALRFRTDAVQPQSSKRDPKGLFEASNEDLDVHDRFEAEQQRVSLPVRSVIPGFSGTSDREVFDLVLNVMLNDERGVHDNDKLATECVDFAKALQTRVTDDAVAAQARVALDMNATMAKIKTQEWKQDPVQQSRAGLWALHVAAKRAGLSTQNLSQKFKQKAIEAFGRLALQTLANAKAEQRNTFKSKDADMENTFKGGVVMPSKSSHALQVDVNALLREESTLQDLQLLQNGLDVETTADELLEAFVETLRTEMDLESEDAQRDLSGIFQAKTVDKEARHVKFAATEHSREAFADMSKPFRADVSSTDNARMKTDVTRQSHGVAHLTARQASVQTVKTRKNPWALEQAADVALHVDAHTSEETDVRHEHKLHFRDRHQESTVSS